MKIKREKCYILGFCNSPCYPMVISVRQNNMGRMQVHYIQPITQLHITSNCPTQHILYLLVQTVYTLTLIVKCLINAGNNIQEEFSIYQNARVQKYFYTCSQIEKIGNKNIVCFTSYCCCFLGYFTLTILSILLCIAYKIWW